MLVRKLPTSSYFEMLILSMLRYEPFTKLEAVSTVQRNIEAWGLSVNQSSLYKAFSRLEERGLIESESGQVFSLTYEGLQVNYWLQNISKNVAEAAKIEWSERTRLRGDFEAQIEIEESKRSVENCAENLRQKIKMANSLTKEERLQAYELGLEEMYPHHFGNQDILESSQSN